MTRSASLNHSLRESSGEGDQDRYYCGPELRSWQAAALDAWERNGRRGVVEAITGTGKTILGIRAMRDVVALGGKALVLVPTRALLEQWHERVRTDLSGVRVGLLTEGRRDTFYENDILVATVQTAARQPPRPVSLGLIVADEAHRYGSSEFAKALHESYDWRLGLTATLERNDDGVGSVLVPYFNGSVFSYGYRQAIDDGVVAPFHLAMVGVRFTLQEQEQFRRATERCSDTRRELQVEYEYPEDWGAFFAEVQTTMQRDHFDEETALCAGYLQAFAERRRIMSEAKAKESFMEQLAPALVGAPPALLFTETKDSAARIAFVVNKHTPAYPLTSDAKPAERKQTLDNFRKAALRVLCTPRILDEGVDVPDAGLAIILASSSSRRQMIQRMGRVIRLKSDGSAARVLITFVEGTPEDPSTGGHESFLDTVAPFAATTRTFSASNRSAIAWWLAGPPEDTRSARPSCGGSSY